MIKPTPENFPAMGYFSTQNPTPLVETGYLMFLEVLLFAASSIITCYPPGNGWGYGGNNGRPTKPTTMPDMMDSMMMGDDTPTNPPNRGYGWNPNGMNGGNQNVQWGYGGQ